MRFPVKKAFLRFKVRAANPMLTRSRILMTYRMMANGIIRHQIFLSRALTSTVPGIGFPFVSSGSIGNHHLFRVPGFSPVLSHQGLITGR